MAEPVEPLSSQPFEVTGTWQAPPPAVDAPGVRNESPTVRSGAGSSSQRRRSLPPFPGPGDRLGTFVLEESIGAGGMGAVFAPSICGSTGTSR